MLDSAGVEFRVAPSNVDESAIKGQFSTPADIAHELAKAKATDVSSNRSEDWIVGSDSVVSIHRRLFDKPRDRKEAADHLRFFSGKEMTLTSAVALARGGTVDWSHVESATLQVRSLSNTFIESYLDAEWPEVGYCVGVFRLEGRGVQLFDRIDGNYFTVLGMPLLPLLGALRERDLLRS